MLQNKVVYMLKNFKLNLIVIIYVFTLVSCQVKEPKNVVESSVNIKILPDYNNITIPWNMAPLNFSITADADKYITKLYVENSKKSIVVEGKEVHFDLKKWHNILSDNKGDTIYLQVYLKKNGVWEKYPLLKNYIAEEPIDNYVTYRLIQPLFVTYHELLIEQRDLTSFEEKTIFNTRLTSSENKAQCVNCHSFQDYNKTGKMQMHFRGVNSGTVISKGNKLEKFDLKTDSTISGGVYPSWHPSRNLIAYSVNKIHQNFHTKNKEKTEVQDRESDLILYNIDKNEVSKIIAKENVLETFPYWSPDGKFLYFSSANYTPKLDDIALDLAQNYAKVKYNLMRLSFNEKTMEFSTLDTVYDAAIIGKSATFPRVSPSGRYLLFTMGEYGNFHIWHKSSDLYLMDLKTRETRSVDEINSNDTESYHSWSSNGKWVVFSSRRQDGAYTRFYISYFNGEGKFTKPFILPQKDPMFYHNFFKSYNIPEFMVEPIGYSPHDFVEALLDSVKSVTFSDK